MALTDNKGQVASTKPNDNKLLAFTLWINRKIAQFERDNNVQLISSSQGWLQYPDQYPNQKWIQLFSVVDSTSPIHCS